AGAALAEAYRFLRRVENRLQMWADAQTHRLPEQDEARERLARGLGFADWTAFCAALDGHRRAVGAEFEALLALRDRGAPPDALAR
ncbi:hypothetical protein ABTE22_19175, partial [Acinetobacter baumannii]